MKEHEIRPQKLEAEVSRLAAQDATRLLALSDGFVAVPCPACLADGSVLMFEKGGFHFRECGSCSTLFVSPRPTAEMLAEFYSSAESLKFWSRCIFPQSEAVRREKIFRPRVQRVASLLGEKKVDTLVDVGAGFGWFAGLCAEAGLASRVVGVEPSSELAASCRRFQRVEVLEAPIEQCYQSLHADVITSFELIEHLFDPGEFLQSCMAGLKPGGIFVCTTPNWHGFDIQTLRQRSSNVWAPNHLNYFNPRSVTTLLRRVGFEEIVVTTPGELDVDILYNQIREGAMSPDELPTLGSFIKNATPEAREDLQRFLQRHNLSSNMMAVAKKPSRNASDDKSIGK